jgi:PPOX class probable F420-dependent enzyme
MTITAEQDAFLRDHRWALVATVGRSGRPQVTMVAYHWDGHDIVMSIRSTAAKWKNLLERPDIAVTVTDDRGYLTVSGRADGVTADPARTALTERVLHSLLPPDAAMLQGEFERGLDAAKRVVIRLVPERVIGRI